MRSVGLTMAVKNGVAVAVALVWDVS
jgi:hypothetical protein